MGDWRTRVEQLRDPQCEPLMVGEEALMGRLERVCRRLMDQNEEQTGLSRRAAHAKVQAYVQATFEVAQGLPRHVRQGVFSEPGRRYDARVRLSTTNPHVASDRSPDITGLAIKLLGVEGERLFSDFQEGTQDFVLASAPQFFTHTPEQFAELLEANADGGLGMARYFVRNPGALWRYGTGIWASRHAPLEADFFSQTPYAIGTQPAHWFARTRLTDRQRAQMGKIKDRAKRRDPHHWRVHLLSEWLSERPLTVELCARLPARGDHVDNATRPWRGELLRLGDLNVPPQQFATQQWMHLGERMSFNPWNGVVEHRPLGAFGRARAVYAATEGYRRARRGDGTPTSLQELSQLPAPNDPPYVPPPIP